VERFPIGKRERWFGKQHQSLGLSKGRRSTLMIHPNLGELTKRRQRSIQRLKQQHRPELRELNNMEKQW
jgi:hypothetical protein